MILDNLTRALKTQNWLAAGLEFVIVIAGVVIGFQIQAWNQERLDRSQETDSLIALHDELERELTVVNRIADDRLTNHQEMLGAIEIIFGLSESRPLTDNECSALTSAHILYVGRSTLPTLTRLQSTGRLDIIRNDDIRLALTRLIQAREALERALEIEEYLFDLADLHPEAFNATFGYFDPEGDDPGEPGVAIRCEVELVRTDNRLRYHISRNADGYDAFLRDGLQPWLTQMQHTHQVLGAALGIQHDETSSR